MPESFIIGTLEIAKVLIAVFVMNYSFFFLKRSKNFKEKRSWGSLYIASLFLFAIVTIGALEIFRVGIYDQGPFQSLKSLAEFSFMACFLFWFIYTHEMTRGK